MRIVRVTRSDWIHGEVGVWTRWKWQSELSVDLSPVTETACVWLEQCKPGRQQDVNEDNDRVLVCDSTQQVEWSVSKGGSGAWCYRPEVYISLDSGLSPGQSSPVVSRGSGIRHQFELQELLVRTPVDGQRVRSDVLQDCEWHSKFVLHGLRPRLPMCCPIHIFYEWLKTMSRHWDALFVGRCGAGFVTVRYKFHYSAQKFREQSYSPSSHQAHQARYQSHGMLVPATSVNTP